MATTMTKPHLRPYITAFILAMAGWLGYVLYSDYQHWQATGLGVANMRSTLRNGVLTLAGAVLIIYGASWAWMHRSASAADGSAKAGSPSLSVSPEVARRNALLAQTGPRFVLEVRGLGMVVARGYNGELWRDIEKKADNYATFLSQNPKDYPDNSDDRGSDINLSSGMAFGGAGRHAVERWPIPVIVWEAPKDPQSDARAAGEIADARTQGRLGISLFLWEDDANTDDGAAMLRKLYTFFDTHPDVPSAMVFSLDGSASRELLRKPGSGLPREGQFIPEIPESMVAVLVSRSDRVDKLIRPFAVEQTDAVNMDHTQYDIIKLWNLYWDKSDGVGPDDFDAYYKKQAEAAGIPDMYINSIGTMQSSWWQKQLPELWKQIGNQGPGHFTPTPYIPVRWTTWQLKQFDDAPLLGYLHRPVDVKLTDEHGHPLRSAAQIAALKVGWEQALATLSDGEQVKRVFYDTTGDKTWVAPLSQGLIAADPAAPSLTDVKEGYDIGNRISNTGVSSPLVQIGLGLISSYQQGGASATVNRRPNGMASIIMVSPPDAAAQAANAERYGGKSPF